MEKQKSVYNTLRFLIKTLIYSRLWIALCTLCYVQSSFILFWGRTDIAVYAVFLALGSYLLYVLPFLYYGIKGVIRASNPRQLWVERDIHRLYITAAVVAIATAVLGIFYFDVLLRIVMNGFVIVLITVLYELPLIPYRGRFVALRQAGWLKPLLLAFVWWYMGAYLVAIGSAGGDSAKPPLTAQGIYFLCLQYVFMLVLCVLFDIRDTDNDRLSKINTWPVALGIAATRYILLALCLLCMAAIVALLPFGGLVLGYLAVFGFLSAFCLLPLQKMPWWFYDIAIDGMMVVQWGLLWVIFS